MYKFDIKLHHFSRWQIMKFLRHFREENVGISHHRPIVPEKEND